MNAETEQSYGTVGPPGIVEPLRHRRPDDGPRAEPSGKLLYPDLAEPYLTAARAAFDEPTSINCRAAADAAFHLATRYTSWDMITRGGSPREARAGQQLFEQARAYRTSAAHDDGATDSL